MVSSYTTSHGADKLKHLSAKLGVKAGVYVGYVEIIPEARYTNALVGFAARVTGWTPFYNIPHDANKLKLPSADLC